MQPKRTSILLLMASAALLVAQNDPPGRVGRLNFISGPVSFQPAGMTDWVEASVNRPLTTGDDVWVGDGGRAEIHVGSTGFRLGPNTEFQFLNLDDQTAQIRLTQGTVTVRLRSLPGNQNFELDTPSMAFTPLRPGEYRIAADPNSQTTSVTVRGGAGQVTGGGQAFPVYAGQQAIVTGGDQISYNVVAAPQGDGWDQWTGSRDRLEDQSQSARYVSREVTGYEDLDQNGRWESQSGYGQVWIPTSVASDWAPYHDGHWSWVSPWGWTWVDDAPWGFAPYHYGRWARFGPRWGWVPGPMAETPYYAPALVGWIGGGGGRGGFSIGFSIGDSAAVGWFPLGPREPYFPAYDTSPRYFSRVNTTNTVINNTTINNYYNDSRNSNNTVITNINYANQRVPNAVMAVPQDTFASGRSVRQNGRSVPAAQLAAVRVASAPAVAPQQASVLGPRAAAASSAHRPPANVMNRPVVARTAPPPAPVPFAQQQAALAQRPGRPLAPAAVQQMRQRVAPSQPAVRVMNMRQVKQVQPVVGAGPQFARPAISVPGLPGRSVVQAPPTAAQAPNAAPVPGGRPSNFPPPSAAQTNGRSQPPSASPRAVSQPPNSRAPSVTGRPGAPGTVPANAPGTNIPQRPGTTPTPELGRRNIPQPSTPPQPTGRVAAPEARPGIGQPNGSARQSSPPVTERQRAPAAPKPEIARPPNNAPTPSPRPDGRAPAAPIRPGTAPPNNVPPNAPTPRPAPRLQERPPSQPPLETRPSSAPPQPPAYRRPSAPPPNPTPQPYKAPAARPAAPPPERPSAPPPRATTNRPSAPPPPRVEAPVARPPAPAPRPNPAPPKERPEDRKDPK